MRVSIVHLVLHYGREAQLETSFNNDFGHMISRVYLRQIIWEEGFLNCYPIRMSWCVSTDCHDGGSMLRFFSQGKSSEYTVLVARDFMFSSLHLRRDIKSEALIGRLFRVLHQHQKHAPG
jgi:hypothetical protein